MATGIQLGQSAPANTTAASIYSPGSNIVTNVTTVMIANNTGTAAQATLYHDDDGTTYANATMIYNASIAANSQAVIDFGDESGIWMADSSGNLAVQTGTADALTFTVYGKEYVD